MVNLSNKGLLTIAERLEEKTDAEQKAMKACREVTKAYLVKMKACLEKTESFLE